MESIFLHLAYLALGSIPSLAQLRYEAPGEWGKLLGFDRISEVKTLREKIGPLGDAAERAAFTAHTLRRTFQRPFSCCDQKKEQPSTPCKPVKANSTG